VSGPISSGFVWLSPPFLPFLSLASAAALQLFRDVVILVRDTGMRNEKELYKIRIENIDWDVG
jgi:hypothetical protein